MDDDRAVVSIEVEAHDLAATANVTASPTGLKLELSTQASEPVLVEMHSSLNSDGDRTVNVAVTRDGQGLGLMQVVTPKAKSKSLLLYLAVGGDAKGGALTQQLYLQAFTDPAALETQVEAWIREYQASELVLDPLFHLGFVVAHDPRLLEALQNAPHSDAANTTDGDASTGTRRDALHLSEECRMILPDTSACELCVPDDQLAKALEALLEQLLSNTDHETKPHAPQSPEKGAAIREALWNVAKALSKFIVKRAMVPRCAVCFAEQWMRLDHCATEAADEKRPEDCRGVCDHLIASGGDNYTERLESNLHDCVCDCSPEKCQEYAAKTSEEYCFSTCEGDGLCIRKKCADDQECIAQQCVPRVCETDCGDEGCPESQCPEADFRCVEQKCVLKPTFEPEPADPDPTPTGSTSTHSAYSTGDPHLKTIDGLGYDAQLPGEYVLLELIDDPSGPRVQARAQRHVTDICPHVAWNRAIAAAIGDARVAFYADEEESLWVDGSVVSFGVDEVLDLGGNETLRRSAAKTWEVHWADGGILQVRKVAVAGGHHLDVTLQPSTLWRARTRGLFGDFDGDPANDLVTRDGTKVDQPVPWAHLYERLVVSYRISAEESLFDYAENEGPETYAEFDIPTAPALSSMLPPALVENARTICEATEVSDEALLEACVIDVVCSGGDASQADWIREVEPGAVSIEVDYTGHELGATESNPGESCAHVLASGGSMGNGTYWIRSGDSSELTYCEMNLDGGGWTLLVDSVAESLEPGAIKTYLYAYADRWYRSPPTTLNWAWSEGKELLGEYSYFDGVAVSSLTCTGSAEKPEFGVGCSNGPGNTPKVLPIYDSASSTGQCTVCQDSSHAFGEDEVACQTNVSVYVR